VNGLIPANPVAVNNIATCHVFNNDAGKALDTLVELIKMDTPNSVSEQLILNVREMTKVQFDDKQSEEAF
jgi:hypothetical protein